MGALRDRFYFEVHPTLTRWTVTFGPTGAAFTYGTEAEAMQVASRAALRHWLTCNEPSGVKWVDEAGESMEAASYG